jgi:hypothetical protein
MQVRDTGLLWLAAVWLGIAIIASMITVGIFAKTYDNRANGKIGKKTSYVKNNTHIPSKEEILLRPMISLAIAEENMARLRSRIHELQRQKTELEQELAAIRPQYDPITTSSITRSRVVPTYPSYTTNGRTLFAVQLASGSSSAKLREKWQQLKTRHQDMLGNLEMRISGTKDLQLIAGPFANAADAAFLCAMLRNAKEACAETTFNSQ